MESAVPGGEHQPFSVDTDILTIVETESFACLYDVPYVTVNWVDGEIQAEVILSGVDEIDHDRLTAAHTEAAKYGMRSYARYFGDLYEGNNAVTVLYSDNPSKGLIWSLENEVGDAWLR